MGSRCRIKPRGAKTPGLTNQDPGGRCDASAGRATRKVAGKWSAGGRKVMDAATGWAYASDIAAAQIAVVAQRPMVFKPDSAMIDLLARQAHTQRATPPIGTAA